MQDLAVGAAADHEHFEVSRVQLKRRHVHESDWGSGGIPVWREPHSQHRRNIQVSRLVHDALRYDAAALVDNWEEDELDDVLSALHGRPLLMTLQQACCLRNISCSVRAVHIWVTPDQCK